MLETMRLMTWCGDIEVGEKRRSVSNQNKLFISIECLLCGRHLMKFAYSGLRKASLYVLPDWESSREELFLLTATD